MYKRGFGKKIGCVEQIVGNGWRENEDDNKGGF